MEVCIFFLLECCCYGHIQCNATQLSLHAYHLSPTRLTLTMCNNQILKYHSVGIKAGKVFKFLHIKLSEHTCRHQNMVFYKSFIKVLFIVQHLYIIIIFVLVMNILYTCTSVQICGEQIYYLQPFLQKSKPMKPTYQPPGSTFVQR